ncbi:MAG: hypothetical protein A3I61_13140 [Acidobacteria bacterium RIFCSPLOWO2_02_FULL_68_18]|nr:MAG: hypothetical protein A3I61_13140 [Acidobacteria bacterium RIFCSPLOWO2_02_FULL_68_18]OFW51889.1 MAG: hypothetical protein A3G77_00785 [Acidobacteria bacterium RIFCSPLOWO2_12_FULL_68_19]
MGRWRTDTDDWLNAEQQGPDEAAEAALARVFATVPTLQPSPAFVTRTAEAAWTARTRRRQSAGLAAAAAVLAAAAGAVVAYAVFGTRVGWLMTTAAAVASGSVLSLVSGTLTAAEWWSAAAAAGRTAVSAVVSPFSVAALGMVGLVAAAALYLLHRLLRSDVVVRRPGAICV